MGDNRITPREAFDIGFQWAHATSSNQCWDSRDIGRVMTADFMPPQLQALANRMNGFRDRSHGMMEAMNLIRAELDAQEARAIALAEPNPERKL